MTNAELRTALGEVGMALTQTMAQTVAVAVAELYDRLKDPDDD